MTWIIISCRHPMSLIGLTWSVGDDVSRLGWPIGTVKTRMRRAHRRLREQPDRSSLSAELAS